MNVDLKPLLFWNGMKRDIVNFVAILLEFQDAKVEY
jgi:hypothetical protein